MGITLNNVSYRYPTASIRGEGEEGWALRNIELEINDGELLVVTGQNGSGKTTLCLALNGLVPHFFKGKFEGNIQVNGKNTNKFNTTDLVSEIGIVFQNPFDQLTGAAETVYDEIAIGPENLGLPIDEIHERVKIALDDVGITHLKDRNPFQLSGGQQQRVAIASLLTMRPKIMIFDEPTSQLDPVGTEEVFDVIKRLHSQGMTIILSEHKINAISLFATRVLILQDGIIVRIGEPRDILTDKELHQFGILPPESAELGHILVDEGIWKSKIPLSIDEMKSGLLELLK